MKGLVIINGKSKINGLNTKILGLKIAERLIFTFKEAGITDIIVTGDIEGKKVKSLFSGRILKNTQIRFKPASTKDDMVKVFEKLRAENSENETFIVSYDNTVIDVNILKKLIDKKKDFVNFNNTVFKVKASLLPEFFELETKSEVLIPEGFLIRVNSKEDRKKATSYILKSIRKPMEIDGVVSYYLMRKITQPISRLLSYTPITPNMLTVTAFLVELLGLYKVFLGGYSNTVLGMGLFLLGAYIDCFDGEIARMKFMKSKIGGWLDTIFDDLSNIGLVIALMGNLYKTTHNSFYLLIGTLTLVYMVFTVSYFYYKLLFQVGKEDVTMVPLFFYGDNSSGASKILNFFKYFVKRDFFTFAYFILAVLNFTQVILITLLMATTVTSGVLLYQLLFIEKRSDAVKEKAK